ncbi:SprT family protein [Desmospora sp. 8437]|nr:SprT family protein [Desmospora sp. 8437]
MSPNHRSTRVQVRPGDDHALQCWVEALSMEWFGKPFTHRARFNSRLRTTGGRYFLEDHRIEISPRHLEELGMEVVGGIIRHELCHYHLHLEGKGYRHRDADFKELLKQVNGLRYTPPLPGNKGGRTRPVRYVLQCQACGRKAWRKKRMDPSRYRCGVCGGQLSLEEV